MMLRTDMALTTDKEFRKYSQQYAKDEQAFFGDFSKAFSKCVPLLARAALPRTLSDDVLTPCSHLLLSAGSSTSASRRPSCPRRCRSRRRRTRRRRRHERPRPVLSPFPRFHGLCAFEVDSSVFASVTVLSCMVLCSSSTREPLHLCSGVTSASSG